MCDGEYNGLHVAIKHPRANKVDSDRAFKVPPTDPNHHRCLPYAAVMPRDHHLETSVSSKHPTLTGDL